MAGREIRGQSRVELAPYLARTPVILARRSPTEKLALSGYGTCSI